MPRTHTGPAELIGPTYARLVQGPYDSKPRLLVSGVWVAVEDGPHLVELFVKLRQRGAAKVIRTVLAQLED